MGYEIDILAVGEESNSGDAIAFRFGNLNGSRDEQTVAVIDGGFKESGEKLVEHIQKYYKTDEVDFVISTHPDGDHINGLEIVLEELSVESLVMHCPWKQEGMAALFNDGRVTDNSISERLKNALNKAYDLSKLAESEGIKIIEPFTGEIFTDCNGGCLKIIGPTEDYYKELLVDVLKKDEERKKKAAMESALDSYVKKFSELWGTETLDDTGETSPRNNTSAITLFTYSDQNILFTGDAGIPALTMAVDYLDSEKFNFDTLNFIQVPHHGSQRNIGPSLLNRLIGPIQKGSNQEPIKSAFVSAAKKGEPKHPSKRVTNAFKRRGAPVYRPEGILCKSHDAPTRKGWSPVEPLPFYNETEE